MTHFRIFRAVLALILLAASRPLAAEAPASAEITVAAAADLAFALKDVAEAFEKDTGVRVKLVFGATGLLTKQIEEGAPFDLFAAANVSFADRAVASGTCFADTKALYARGHLVIWSSPESKTAPPKDVADLKDARFRKIAIANPETAPYGMAAKQALESAGIWKDVDKRIVYGENVRQALQFAETGNAEAAIVALSLAVVIPGPRVAIEENLHKPIDQAMVVCKNGGNPAAARRFAAFVNGDRGRVIMRRFGFLLPGEKELN